MFSIRLGLPVGKLFIRLLVFALSVSIAGCAPNHTGDSVDKDLETAERTESTIPIKKDRDDFSDKRAQGRSESVITPDVARVNSLVDDGGTGIVPTGIVAKLPGGSSRRPLDLDRLVQGVREEFELAATRDPASELDFLRERYEAGDQEVAMALGLFLAYGDKSVTDPELAAEFFRVAGANGNARALVELGRMYLSGLGVPADAATAEQHFTDAMAAGDSEGAFLLSMGHRLELFPDSDPDEAAALLIIAAESGHEAASKSAYELIRSGEMTLGNDQRVLNWLQRSAESGDSMALYSLGDYYLRAGQADKALAVFEVSIEAGSLLALPKVLRLSRMSPSDPETRTKAAEIARTHAESGGTTASAAHFFLAILESYNANADIGLIRDHLKDAEERHYYHATVALNLMDKGASARDALRQTWGLSVDEAYARMIDIRYGQTQSAASGESNILVKSTTNVVYPAELMAERILGQVTLEFTVNTDGSTSNVKAIESSHPAFTNAAVEAFSAWEFEPATKDGEKITKRVRIEVNFSPDD